MKIGIIGGGSIGLLFAFYLNKQHHVTLYVRSDEQNDIIAAEGIYLIENDMQRNERIHVEYIHNWQGNDDITIVAVKEYHLDSLISILNVKSQTTFIFLQNGMGHLRKLAHFDKSKVYMATVEHGALKLNANEVIHTGVGVTKLAPLCVDMNTSAMTDWIEGLQLQGFPFILFQNYEEMMLKKLVANAVINPLTAILKVRNGLLIEDSAYFEVVKLLFLEVTEALSIAEKDELFTYVKSICRKTAHNQSSMLKDIIEGRQTEIDSILGYCMKQAEQNHKDVPLLTSCYFMIKGMEKKGEKD